MLANYKATYNEAFKGFKIRTFDGRNIVVGEQPTRRNLIIKLNSTL